MTPAVVFATANAVGGGDGGICFATTLAVVVRRISSFSFLHLIVLVPTLVALVLLALVLVSVFTLC